MYVKEAIAYAIASFLRYSIQVSKGLLLSLCWQIAQKNIASFIVQTFR